MALAAAPVAATGGLAEVRLPTAAGTPGKAGEGGTPAPPTTKNLAPMAQPSPSGHDCDRRHEGDTADQHAGQQVQGAVRTATRPGGVRDGPGDEDHDHEADNANDDLHDALPRARVRR